MNLVRILELTKVDGVSNGYFPSSPLLIGYETLEGEVQDGEQIQVERDCSHFPESFQSSCEYSYLISKSRFSCSLKWP